MKTRDEILELLHEELFSVRTAFFALLDACVVYKGHRLVWPDALTVITVAQWNACYDGAMTFKAACRRGDKPSMPPRYTKTVGIA